MHPLMPALTGTSTARGRNAMLSGFDLVERHADIATQSKPALRIVAAPAGEAKRWSRPDQASRDPHRHPARGG
jgi:hypothetical protein